MNNLVPHGKLKRRKNVPMAVHGSFICPTCHVAWDINGHNMVPCNKCSMEYHWDCVGYTKEMHKNEEAWYCSNCKPGIIDNNQVDEPMADPNQLLHRTLQFAVSNYAIADGVDGVNGVNNESAEC